MIRPYYDCMNYSNVVSMVFTVDLMNVKQLENVKEDFKEYVLQLGLGYKGPLTFYMENLGGTKVNLHLFLPVQSMKVITAPNVRCYSYYSQEKVICMPAKLKDMKDMRFLIERMNEKCTEDGYIMYGPLYYVEGKEIGVRHLILKVGVMKL